MINRFIFLISISIPIFLWAGDNPSSAHPLLVGIELADKSFTTEAAMVFDEEIKLFIQTEFEKDISDEYLIVQRKLLKIILYRVEVIDGRDVYSVHIEFVARITDKESVFSHTTLRGQEALFIIKQGKIADIMPFSEYVIETDKTKIEEYLGVIGNE